MTRTLMMAAGAVALSTGAASAQGVYVTPGYDYVAPAYVAPAPAYVFPAPAYVAPAPVYVAPPVVRRTVVTRRVYDYAPAYSETVVVGPGW